MVMWACDIYNVTIKMQYQQCKKKSISKNTFYYSKDFFGKKMFQVSLRLV